MNCFSGVWRTCNKLRPFSSSNKGFFPNIVTTSVNIFRSYSNAFHNVESEQIEALKTNKALLVSMVTHLNPTSHPSPALLQGVPKVVIMCPNSFVAYFLHLYYSQYAFPALKDPSLVRHLSLHSYAVFKGMKHSAQVENVKKFLMSEDPSVIFTNRIDRNFLFCVTMDESAPPTESGLSQNRFSADAETANTSKRLETVKIDDETSLHISESGQFFYQKFHYQESNFLFLMLHQKKRAVKADLRAFAYLIKRPVSVKYLSINELSLCESSQSVSEQRTQEDVSPFEISHSILENAIPEANRRFSLEAYSTKQGNLMCGRMLSTWLRDEMLMRCEENNGENCSQEEFLTRNKIANCVFNAFHKILMSFGIFKMPSLGYKYANRLYLIGDKIKQIKCEQSPHLRLSTYTEKEHQLQFMNPRIATLPSPSPSLPSSPLSPLPLSSPPSLSSR